MEMNEPLYSTLNWALVPSNSLAFLSAQDVTNQDVVVAQRRRELELHTSLSKPISPRDELVDEFSIHISKADEEVATQQNGAN
jgi:hypothetical protein